MRIPKPTDAHRQRFTALVPDARGSATCREVRPMVNKRRKLQAILVTSAFA
jgi:hypothetical protein